TTPTARTACRPRCAARARASSRMPRAASSGLSSKGTSNAFPCVVHADEPMAEALREELERHAKKLRKRLKKAKNDGDDGVHEARRVDGARDARAALRGKKRRALVRALCALAARDDEKRPNDPAKSSPRLVRHFTHEELWRRYDAVRAFDARDDFDVDALHQLR